MKALIIRQKVSSGINDYIHGGGRFLNRILVPDADNLVFGVFEGNVFAFTGYNFAEEEPEVLSSIEVSVELVSLALAFAAAKDALQKRSLEIKSFIE